MRNFGRKSLDEMKERLRMRGFLPPEDEALEGFDAEGDIEDEDEDADGEDMIDASGDEGDEPFKEDA